MGLPLRMTMDNGAPWGSGDEPHGITPLALRLMQLHIRVSHSRPYHPQTQGKNERFSGTLNREVIRGRIFSTLIECQRTFDLWRDVYNLERPHEALGLEVPATRYRPSPRPFPETLPPIVYPDGALVRRVQDKGRISFSGRLYKLPEALKGHLVAIQPRISEDGVYDVIFCTTRIATLNLKAPVS